MTAMVQVSKKPASPLPVGSADVVGGSKPLSSSRKSVKKREAIIRAAIEIINARSYALATMTEIAASLDLRDATLYYYFPSKQALAYACHVRSLERFEHILAEADRDGGTGCAKLNLLIDRFLDDSVRHGPQLYFGEHSYLDDEQRNVVDGTANRLELEIERFVNEGVADGSLRGCEPTLVVQLLLGMLIWLAKWTPGIKDLTADRLRQAIRTLTMDGLQLAPTD